MTISTVLDEDLSTFEKKIEAISLLIKNGCEEIFIISNNLQDIANSFEHNQLKTFKELEEAHSHMQSVFERVTAGYEELKKEYAELRERGILLIDAKINEIRGKKGELVHTGFAVDDAVRGFETPKKILDMRQREVMLFNSLDECYNEALVVTSKLKLIDSKANMIGYQYAEFTGIIRGLNSTFIALKRINDMKTFRNARGPAVAGDNEKMRWDADNRESGNYIR